MVLLFEVFTTSNEKFLPYLGCLRTLINFILGESTGIRCIGRYFFFFSFSFPA